VGTFDRAAVRLMRRAVPAFSRVQQAANIPMKNAKLTSLP
jgi:hypothetical protein